MPTVSYDIIINATTNTVESKTVVYPKRYKVVAKGCLYDPHRTARIELKEEPPL